MTIEVINHLADLESLRPEWSALWNRSPEATPFQSPEWLVPWTRHLFKGGEISVVTTREGGILTGIAPFFRWGLEQRTVSFLGAGISDYGDVLGEACPRSGLSAIGEWDLLDLQELRSASPVLQLGPGEQCSVCPVLALRDYPASMDRKHTVDLRRARNRLEKSHTVQFSTADQATLFEYLNTFFDLHNARYHSLDPALEAFHREAASGFLAAGLLRLHVLLIDGVTAAAIYAFAAHSRLYFYLSGFDQALAKLSPGAVLIQWAIEQAIEEGLEEADFLRDPEPYKYLWGARDRINYRLLLSRFETRSEAEKAQPEW